MISNKLISYYLCLTLLFCIHSLQSQSIKNSNDYLQEADLNYQKVFDYRGKDNDSLEKYANLSLSSYKKANSNHENLIKLYGLLIEVANDQEKKAKANALYSTATGLKKINSIKHCSAYTYLTYTYNKFFISLRDYDTAIRCMKQYWRNEEFNCSDIRQKVYFLHELSRTLAESGDLTEASKILSIADSINYSSPKGIENPDLSHLS